MNKYRKKPIVIEAIQLQNNYNSIKKCVEFMGQHVSESYMSKIKFEEYVEIVKNNGMKIQTLEGEITASINDYIIKGVKGEFYPCKPDIFEQTYEKIMEKRIIPFDIEKAKNGAEVINMIGEKIKIIYYDVKSCYPIVGLRFDKTTGTEILNTYTKEGKYIELCYSSDQDLQIVEEVSTYNEIIDEMFERRYKLLCYFADKNLQPVEEVITYDEIFEIIDEITRAVDKNTIRIEKFKAIEFLFKIANYYNKEKINFS